MFTPDRQPLLSSTHRVDVPSESGTLSDDVVNDHQREQDQTRNWERCPPGRPVPNKYVKYPMISAMRTEREIGAQIGMFSPRFCAFANFLNWAQVK